MSIRRSSEDFSRPTSYLKKNQKYNLRSFENLADYFYGCATRALAIWRGVRETMSDLDGMTDEEKLDYVISTARQLSEITLRLGQAEAAALLSVIAGSLAEEDDAA